MSKDIQEVYESLMNFQKRDSSMMQSFSMPPQKKTLEQQDSVEDSDRLSDILAAYGIKPKSDDNSIEVNRVPMGRNIHHACFLFKLFLRSQCIPGIFNQNQNNHGHLTFTA